MEQDDSTMRPADARHRKTGDPSPWIVRHTDQIPPSGTVLDLAAGGGRHARYLRDRGHPVVAVDRSLDGLRDFADMHDVELIEADLEDGSPWPLAGRSFDAVVVANYLHRPLLPAIVSAVAPGGLLLYETFALGNERFGKPNNPDYLLKPEELLAAVAGTLRVLAYEDIVVEQPKPAAIQHICARRDA